MQVKKMRKEKAIIESERIFGELWRSAITKGATVALPLLVVQKDAWSNREESSSSVVVAESVAEDTKERKRFSVPQREGRWSSEEDAILRAVEEMGAKSWKWSQRCLTAVYTCSVSIDGNAKGAQALVKGKWTPKEDEVLKKYIERVTFAKAGGIMSCFS